MTTTRTRRFTAALMTCTALGLSMTGALAVPGNACAAETPPSALEHAPAEVAEDAQVAFDIAAQPLGAAIDAFIAATGWQVGYAAEVTRDRKSSGVTGRLTPTVALERLLAGTGVTFRLTGARTVALDGPQASGGRITLGTVSVEGRIVPAQAEIGTLPTEFAGGQVARGARAGVLGNQDMMEVPFTMTAHTETAIRNQQAETIGDILDNDPAIRSTYGYGNFAELFVVRGFPLYNDDLSVDGLYGTSPRQISSTDMFERIEVFKGANAFLNGAAPGATGIGGGINLVPKRAGDEPLTRVTANYGQTLRAGVHADMGRRFGPDDAFGVRINSALRAGETAVKNEERYMHMASGAFDYRGDKLRATVDIATQRQRVDQGRPTVFITGSQVPNAPDASHNYAATYSYTDLEDSFAQTRIEYDLLQNLTLQAAFGVHTLREDGDYASIRVSSNDGTATARRLTVPREDLSLTGQAGIKGHLDTGPLRHKVNAGMSALKSANRNAYEFGTTENTNIYDPVELARGATTSSGGDFERLPLVSKVLLRSYYASDTISDLDERVLLTVGVRYQQIQSLNFNRTSNLETSNFNDTAISPVVGLVYKPADSISLYVNRIEGLQPGGSAPSSAANSGEVLAPYTSVQYEVGGKVDLGNLGAALALFQTTQPSAVTDPTTNIYSADGEQRNRGIEISVFGEPVPGLRLLGGTSLTEAKLTETAGGTNDGNVAVGVPLYQLNASMEWDCPCLDGLTLSARALHTGRQYIDTGNSQEIGSWTRFDMGARLVRNIAGREANFLLNVENIANSGYWASSQGGYLVQGAPFTVKLSMSMDF
ncbi:MAG TPA: TonB-dependent siderophore receptor [Rhodospirillaceae bacterium]|nr:TonB-dependent siderophore receptor [Magnetovibrio sp.]HCS69711.1 TonB-dependent siderophore receptor [Rhodospirillaceae bacterium]|tara:strand:- start:6707 stop:9181 length:2475 start_codon:yes stop_codon:yes gene_type:complete